MNTPHAARGPVSGTVSAKGATGPTTSLWLRILLRCTLVTAAVAVGIAAAGWLTVGGGAALSALAGWLIVGVFFGISLLIGHFVGRSNPSGALGMFMVTYVIKVVGFAAVLFLIGVPPWLERAWFFGTAVASVVIWQAVEIVVFAKSRHQLYNDEDDRLSQPREVNGQ